MFLESIPVKSKIHKSERTENGPACAAEIRFAIPRLICYEGHYE
jgi:hypothetical protein